MNIRGAHLLEDKLERRLKELSPGHPALRYYTSTWDAIDTYRVALKELQQEEKP